MAAILLVDDSRVQLSALKRAAQEVLPKLEIITAGSGEEALAKLGESTQELVIAFLDYNMEGMNGIQLAEKIPPKLPMNKIVLCTANVQKIISDKFTEAGGGCFIAKPFTTDKFKTAVESVLGEATEQYR